MAETKQLLDPVPGHRILSLIPSSTEIVAILGLTDQLVGRSHECDFPESVRLLPVCTRPKFDPHGSSREVHDRVSTLLQSALGVYDIELERLAALKPTHILTQAQCDVCAVSLPEVEAAVAALSGERPQILSLEPNTLADLWNDIERVGAALGGPAQTVVAALKARVQACANRVARLATAPRTVACLEWTEPLMAAGNWVPELVELAGGRNLFGTTGQHSPWLDWAALIAADPEVILFMPCGFDLERTRQEAEILTRRPEWHHLRAAQTGEVYVVDGNQYFNRPGPRLVDSLEILAEILHPGIFSFSYRDTGWQFL